MYQRIAHGISTAAVLFVLLAACSAHAEETIVFVGTPVVRVVSNSTEAKRQTLDDAEQTEYRLLITKKGDKYYWASRENKELVYMVSGAFHWFIAPTSGYVKLIDSRALLEESGPRFRYVEHMGQFLMTVTYWGNSDGFTP